MASATAQMLRNIGLRSSKRSILMLVVAWVLSLAWLGVNFFWRFASVEVLLIIPILSLSYAIASLFAFIYWGVRDIRERDSSLANLLVGVIVAVTLLYFNFSLFQFALAAT
ncbi:hypothetical protein ACFSRY_20540 [Pontibacter locisalis]|uniref:Uncharacterized protein n=1 Tax=Pontibacter locisalis TaxID=1719035 RepID=A0ABW5IT66_9BACT